LSQDECTDSEYCDWTIIETPNGVFEMCADGNGWNDDGGWEDDCDPNLMCATVITCVDGLLYPTACGPDNCDEPIGECDDEEDEGPPECVQDCEGIENVEPEEDGMYFCEWLLYVVAPSGCFEDCDQEVLNEIEETMIICDECLPEGTCDNYFGEDDGEDNCSELSLDECRETLGCEPNFNAAGQFEGCYETGDVDGCMSEEGEYYCVGCEWFVSDCDYYECTSEGWSGPFTWDDCPGEGDGGWITHTLFISKIRAIKPTTIALTRAIIPCKWTRPAFTCTLIVIAITNKPLASNTIIFAFFTHTSINITCFITTFKLTSCIEIRFAT
jgi:hypothetical protein